MIKLKSILTEDFEGPTYAKKHRSLPLTLQGAVSLYKSHCKNFEKDANYIYRGVRSDHKYLIVDPATKERKSRHTANYYTLIMDNSPRWKEYPKRSKSIVCTNSADDKAVRYGNAYLVIPFDGARYGVCPTDDIWNSFESSLNEYGMIDADEFNIALFNLYEELVNENLADVSNELENDALTFFKQLKEFDSPEARKLLEEYAERKQLEDYSGFIIDWLKSKKSFAQFLDSMLDPIKNKFKVISTAKLNINPYDQREVWTDSECLLIRMTVDKDYDLFLDTQFANLTGLEVSV